MAFDARAALAAVLSLLSLGCAGIQRRAVKVPLDAAHPQAVTFPAELRGVYVEPAGGAIKFCAEPSPDVAMQTLQRIAASLDGAKRVEGGLTAEASATLVELAGRSELVLLARELLFRACELSLNEGERGTAGRLYDQVVQLIATIDRGEKDRAAARRSELDLEQRRLELGIRRLDDRSR